MSEKLLLEKYDEDFVKKLENIEGMKQLKEKFQTVNYGSYDIWEDIFQFLIGEFDYQDSSEVRSFCTNVCDRFLLNARGIFLEAKACLKYNLIRLDKRSRTIDTDDEKVMYKELQRISEHIFINHSRKIPDNQESYDITEDYSTIMKRLSKSRKEKEFHARVEFDWDLNKNEDTIIADLRESNYFVLQLMFLLNDRFNLLFCSKTKLKKQYDYLILSGFLDAIKKSEAILDEEYQNQDEVVELYIWEKLTGINLVSVGVEYYIKISQSVAGNKETEEQIKQSIMLILKTIRESDWTLSSIFFAEELFEEICRFEKMKQEDIKDIMEKALSFAKSFQESGNEILDIWLRCLFCLRDSLFEKHVSYSDRIYFMKYELEDDTFSDKIVLNDIIKESDKKWLDLFKEFMENVSKYSL